ncbi:MAG: hypothetical protein E7362_01475 [Clostridiales bacterium]|nr:hypothetical protein [Clostridiales bacterium]
MAGKEDKKQSEENKLKTALLKKALGYEAKETIEEYVSDDGEIRLSKRKVTKKNVPPDITAIKMLLGESQTDITEMTDEELLAERDRLLNILKEAENS